MKTLKTTAGPKTVKISRTFYILALFIMTASSTILYGAAESYEITARGDRNLKIISFIYEKYAFMPAKREYFRHLQEDWLKSKALYAHAHADEKKEKYDKLLKSYLTTNDVLKDICIDMANLGEAVFDDYTDKLSEADTPKTDLSRDKNYNRYIVSRNQFTRAEAGFKKGMYYYSARLYDHGLDLMRQIYRDRQWVFPKGKAGAAESNKADKNNIS